MRLFFSGFAAAKRTARGPSDILYRLMNAMAAYYASFTRLTSARRQFILNFNIIDDMQHSPALSQERPNTIFHQIFS